MMNAGTTSETSKNPLKPEVQVTRSEAQATFELSFGPEFAQQEYSKACRRLSQRINIHGFRRGKAPRQVLEKQLGADRIKVEAMEAFLPRYFADVISEQTLDIIAPPEMTRWEFDPSEGVKITAVVDLRPEITLPELKGLTIQYQALALPENALEQELSALQERFTTLKSVVDRSVEATDVVNIDFDGKVDGEAIRGGSAKNYRLDLVQSPFIPGFAEQLVGHKLHEEFEIRVTFPESYHEASLAGKEALFAIKLNDIQSREKPELNDAFASKINPEFKTIDDLKAHIEKVLNEQVEREVLTRKQRGAVKKLLEIIEVPLTESMIRRETRILLSDIQQRFESQGASWADFIASQGEEAILGMLRNEAEERIKTTLVFGAIARQHNLEVSDEAFFAHAQEVAKARGTEEKVFMRQLANQPQLAQALTDTLLANQIIERLMAENTFEAVETLEPVAETPVAGVGEGNPESVRQTQGEVFDDAHAETPVAEAVAE
ncbi:MAG: trigger factor [Vampirovibrionales bacterium]